MSIQEPNWIAITTLGSPYDVEMDVNAAPGALEATKFRHRTRGFTGQEVQEWRRGHPDEFNPV